jgi:hypothetical protein
VRAVVRAVVESLSKQQVGCVGQLRPIAARLERDVQRVHAGEYRAPPDGLIAKRVRQLV